MTFYYKAIKIEEVTRVVPLIFTKPIFVLIAATFLLGEVFTPLNYFGIASILIGSFIISIKKQEGKRKPTKAILPVIISVLGWAFMDLNGKSVLSVITDPFVFTAYILFGISIFSFLMWIFNLRDIKEAITEGYYKYLFINPLLISISFSLYMTALSLAPASFVAATNSIQSLFVLIYAIVLSRYLPSFIREGMDKRTITIKLLSIILIILGVYIIS